MAEQKLEARFAVAWANCWAKMDALGIGTARMRKQAEELGAVTAARRILSGRRCSDGFALLKDKGQLKLSLEALVLEPAWGGLFTDDEANEALNRLMEAGYFRA